MVQTFWSINEVYNRVGSADLNARGFLTVTFRFLTIVLCVSEETHVGFPAPLAAAEGWLAGRCSGSASQSCSRSAAGGLSAAFVPSRSFFPASPMPKRKLNPTLSQEEMMFRFMKYKLRLWGGKRQQDLLFKWEMASN